MAERRMFAKTIIDSDAFLDMPLSTQALYFHLSMRADDEGFINNPKKVMRMIGANQNELEILLAKRYLLGFESGVVVVKHWKIHNYIQKDRFKPTLYKEERSKLTLKDSNNYTETTGESNMDTECIQDGDTGKVRLGKSKSKSKVITPSNAVIVYKSYPEVGNKKDSIELIEKHLFKHDTEELLRAVDRYTKETIEKRRGFPELKYKNPKTFFNKSILNYVDEYFEEYVCEDIVEQDNKFKGRVNFEL